MDPAKHKIYHEDRFHSRTFLDTYFANKPEMAFEEEGPKKYIFCIFPSANIKGGTLIDISIGPIIYHLYSACEYFKEIILLRFNDHCIIELKRWLHDRTGAFDWTHTLSYVSEKEGRSTQFEEKALQLKSAVKQVLKCYADRENITDPLELPQADCLLVTHVLDVISRDEFEFISNLKKFTKLLKSGGQLLIYGALNATFYLVGKEKFNAFKYDENFIRKAVEGEGFVINHCHVRLRKTKSDLSNFEAIIFISACKT
ncbi:nicotinamide N-methyltransferase-like [Pyxicephalus adspersus]|uniref:nicotinamide N-methyltransferase-like n=1 Tax=Pyxicephalus adspersus TaxID=30357 RepID=UPI003B5BF4D2